MGSSHNAGTCCDVGLSRPAQLARYARTTVLHLPARPRGTQLAPNELGRLRALAFHPEPAPNGTKRDRRVEPTPALG